MTRVASWINRARATRLEDEITRRGIMLKRVGAEHVGPCPKCGGDDRFAINIAKQLFNCRGCGVGGDVIALVQHLDGVDFIPACTALTGEPVPMQNGRDRPSEACEIIVAGHSYHDEVGNVAFVVERREFQNPDGTFVILKDGKRRKNFRQRRPDPDRPGHWINNVNGVSPVPYRLPELIEAICNDRVVFICEGEKYTDALWGIGVPATTNAMGAGKWKDELNKYFAGADVILVPDNDDVGYRHIQDVGAKLLGVAKRVRVLVLPDLPAKGDLCDWLAAGGTREAFDRLVEEISQSQPLTPAAGKPDEKEKAKAADDALIESLAKLRPGIAFARQRKKAAKRLGVPPSAIDAELEARREKEVAPLHGHWIVEPWPDPVDDDSLLRDIIMRLRRHVVCSHDDALAIALWIMLSWVHDEVATHSPMLVITSAEPMSGKTTALAVVSLLIPRSIRSVEITEAALYRSIRRWQPSFALDEFDGVLASDDKAALRSVMNSGHTRGDGVLRINKEKNNEPEIFPTFCPKAIGMVGRKLPPATLTRCIFVELRRRKRDETVERFKHTDDSELGDLRRRLYRWSLDNEDKLRGASPSIPAELENRYNDNWRLQLAIADLAGEDWGDQARLAAVKIERASDSTTVNARMLAATRTILSEIGDGQDAIGSQHLIDNLTADPDSEWAEWRHGKPVTQAQLARLLKPFRIFPEPVRIGGQQVRGYRRSQFEDAWSRYL
jgi:putative DNA primase/helicase